MTICLNILIGLLVLALFLARKVLLDARDAKREHEETLREVRAKGDTDVLNCLKSLVREGVYSLEWEENEIVRASGLGLSIDRSECQPWLHHRERRDLTVVGWLNETAIVEAPDGSIIATDGVDDGCEQWLPSLTHYLVRLNSYSRKHSRSKTT